MVPPGAPDEALAGRLRAAAECDPALRPALLQLKAALAPLHLPRRIPSVWVYRAALDDGARDIPALAAALRRREPELAAMREAAGSPPGPGGAAPLRPALTVRRASPPSGAPHP